VLLDAGLDDKLCGLETVVLEEVVDDEFVGVEEVSAWG
jgi:hypothetical protein